jgi:hypothetical protein
VRKDRAAGAVQYAPSAIRPETVAELGQLAAVRGVDKVRLRLTRAPAIDVRAHVLGEELRAPAGGAWSSALTLYVPPIAWAYVPPTPAAVAGSPITREVIAAADTAVGLYWNLNLTPAKVTASGAGLATGPTVQGGSPSSSAVAEAKSRGLIRFDLTDDALWAGLRIYRSAQLRLSLPGSPSGVAPVLARRVLDPWVEGYGTAPLDFNNSGAIWPGPAYTDAGGTSTAGPTGPGLWTADVTEIVRTWLPRSLGGDALPNLGLVLLSSSEATNQGFTFRSRESPAGPGPTLVINGEG